MKNIIDSSLISYIDKLNEKDSRIKALESHSQELKEHISILKQKNDSLQEENKNLRELLTNITLGYDLDLIDFFSCIYPPYHVAAKFNLTSQAIAKMVSDFQLDTKYKSICRRIKRVKKEEYSKYETTLVFSKFGIHVLKEIIKYCTDKPEVYPYYNHITQGQIINPDYIKSTDYLLEEYKDLWTRLAE